MWYSLILIWACAGNPSAGPWVDPDPAALGCDSKTHWGYTDPLLDFRTLVDCHTAGNRFQKQQPHVYVAWRCVSDPDKKPWSEEEIEKK